MHNENDGWLNALFRGEYGWWYRLLLPGMHNASYPVPLGGTTNFYRRSVLAEISEIREERFGTRWQPAEDLWLSKIPDTGPIPWDPRNVTEDFELGLLLWLEDYELALIPSVTREESPMAATTWIQQRTRWQKGKVQTFFQYLRHRPTNDIGTLHIWLQSVVPHLGPINFTGLVLIAVISDLFLNQTFAPVVIGVLLLGLVFLVEHMLLQAYGYLKASTAPRPVQLFRAALNFVTLFPYWVLVWVADNRALYQLYRNNEEWEKTDHHGRHLSEE
jgi:cellulose synthase/poly-beta-1,6-N-acetylglucosamine synthase-like glycosyltransferase